MFDEVTLHQIASAVAAEVEARLRPASRPRDLLDIEEVAAKLDQSVKTVRRLIDSGELRTVHINSKVQVRAATLEQFIERRERRN